MGFRILFRSEHQTKIDFLRPKIYVTCLNPLPPNVSMTFFFFRKSISDPSLTRFDEPSDFSGQNVGPIGTSPWGHHPLVGPAPLLLESMTRVRSFILLYNRKYDMLFSCNSSFSFRKGVYWIFIDLPLIFVYFS